MMISGELSEGGGACKVVMKWNWKDGTIKAKLYFIHLENDKTFTKRLIVRTTSIPKTNIQMDYLSKHRLQLFDL